MGGTPPPFAENSTKIINLIFEPFPYWILDKQDQLLLPTEQGVELVSQLVRTSQVLQPGKLLLHSRGEGHRIARWRAGMCPPLACD